MIDDKKVAGSKAFNWQQQFPVIFEKGGFDVVIGNPPYVRQELLGSIKSYLEKNYNVFEGTSDLFAYFYERSFQILKKKGLFGFISNTFDKTKAAFRLRKMLTETVTFLNYVDFTDIQIFEGATTYPIIIIAENSVKQNTKFNYTKVQKEHQSKTIDVEILPKTNVLKKSLGSLSWNFNSEETFNILQKIKENATIRERFSKCFYGIKTGFNEAFIIDEKIKKQLVGQHQSSEELIKPFLEGKDLSKWVSPDISKYLIFTRRGTVIENFPAIKTYLLKFKERLTPRNSPEIKVGRKPGPYKWFEIQDSVDYFKIFEAPKISWPNLQSSNKFCIDFNGYYINAPSVVLPIESKGLLCILNSKLIWLFLKSICVVRSGGYLEVKPQYFEQIPIPEIKNEEQFEKAAGNLINMVSSLQSLSIKFRTYLLSTYQIVKLPKKLAYWHELNFGDFIKELNKAIKANNKIMLSEGKEAVTELTKKDEFEWLKLFEEKKKKAQELQNQIDKTEKEIDRMVYELYELTEEEVTIVENS